MVIQVNGKVRDRMKMSILATEEESKNAALANTKFKIHCRQDHPQNRCRPEKVRQHRRMKKIWNEFKEFAVKGNAVDLAIGVIIGAAFGSIVNSLVKDVIMPPISLLTGGLDLSNKFVVLQLAKAARPRSNAR